MPARVRAPILWSILGCMIVLIILGGRFVSPEQLVARSTVFVENFGLIAIFLYGAIYVAATLLCLPVLPLTIAAGLLFGTFLGSLVVSTSTTTAAVAAFLMGRYSARARIKRLASHYPKFGAIDRAVGKEGWKIIFLLRLVVFIPMGISNYLYGLTAVSVLPYAIATHVAMLPGTIFYAYLGSIGRKGLLTGTLDGSDYLIIAAALMAKVTIILYVVRRVRRAMGDMP